MLVSNSFYFHPYLGNMIQFDEHISFSMTFLGVFGMTLLRVTNWGALTGVLTDSARISADDQFQVERRIRE